MGNRVKIFAAFVLAGSLLATPVFAQSGADTYIDALGKVSGACEAAAFKLALDNELVQQKQQMDAQVAMARGQSPDNPMSDANLAASAARAKPFWDCVNSAPDKGAGAYRAFAANTHNAKMREAAKKVLAAWIAYVPAIRVTSNVTLQHGSREYTALQEAISSFKVEAMTAD